MAAAGLLQSLRKDTTFYHCVPLALQCHLLTTPYFCMRINGDLHLPRRGLVTRSLLSAASALHMIFVFLLFPRLIAIALDGWCGCMDKGVPCSLEGCNTMWKLPNGAYLITIFLTDGAVLLDALFRPTSLKRDVDLKEGPIGQRYWSIQMWFGLMICSLVLPTALLQFNVSWLYELSKTDSTWGYGQTLALLTAISFMVGQVGLYLISPRDDDNSAEPWYQMIFQVYHTSRRF